MFSRLAIRHVRTKAAVPAIVKASWRGLHASKPVASAILPQHRRSENNSPDMPWDFTPENKEKIKIIMAKFPAAYKQAATMPLLQMAQEQNNNWLPLAAMNKIAEMLDVPAIRIYETATFYSMYNREPVGKFHLQVCGTTPCQLCGSEKIIETIEKALHIKCGDTTKDGLFTLNEVECLGACVNAPMLQVNNHEFYENLTEETTLKLLQDLPAGKAKVGPQNHQQNCEGPHGKTTLKGEIKPPKNRDLDAMLEAKRQKDAEAAAGAPAAPAGGAAPAAPAAPAAAAAAPKPAAPAAPTGDSIKSKPGPSQGAPGRTEFQEKSGSEGKLKPAAATVPKPSPAAGTGTTPATSGTATAGTPTAAPQSSAAHGKTPDTKAQAKQQPPSASSGKEPKQTAKNPMQQAPGQSSQKGYSERKGDSTNASAGGKKPADKKR